MKLEKTFRSRWSAAWDNRAELRETKSMFERTFALADVAAAKKVELARPGTLSPKGIAQALRTQLSVGAAAELRKHLEAVEANEAAIRAETERLATPEIDRSDLMGEMQRQEMRTWLRSMDDGDRLARLTAPDASPQLQVAALTAAPELSGLRPSAIPQIQQAYVEQTAGEALAALQEREEATTLLRMTVETAAATMREELGMSRESFAVWFETGREPEQEPA